MKRVIALVLLVMGMVLMNSPPVTYAPELDQDIVLTQTSDVSYDIQLELNYDLQNATGLEDGVLKYPLFAWSATLAMNLPSVLFCSKTMNFLYEASELNNFRIPNRPETILWLDHNQMGLTRLDIGECYVNLYI